MIISKICPNCMLWILLNITKKIKFSFSDFQSAFEIYNNASLSIGTRIHGGVAFYHAEFPTLITNQDMRSSEMCDFLNIPCFPQYGFFTGSDFGENIDIPSLINKIDFTRYNKSYKEKFENFNNFKKFIKKIIDYFSLTNLALPCVPRTLFDVMKV